MTQYGQESRRGEDLDASVLLQIEKMLIATYDVVRATSDGALKELIVVWISFYLVYLS